MVRVIGRNLLAIATATILVAAACRDAQSPDPQANLLPGLPLPSVGAIVVSTITSGSSLDPDGYTVTVDNVWSQHIATVGVVTFTGVPIGNHTVTLSGVATNCSVNGTVTVDVPLAGSATFTFVVTCSPSAPPPPPQTGDLTVSASTTGSNLDPDGYTVTVDGGASQAIATNGSVTFTGLAAGGHTVVLSGVAGNCSVSGGTSRSVTVPAGGTASTSFAASCVATPPPTGDLTVSASTTGSNLDPDGYTVTVDGGASQAIATNGSVTFTGPAGDHQIELSGVAGNCTVSGANPRTVTVPAGATTSTRFDVSCAGTPPPAGQVTGRGQVGTAAPQNGNNVQTFDFDVRADLTGRFTGTDYSYIHPAGTPASVTVDRAADPETSITAFRASSSFCSDPNRGVEFEGVGREDTGRLLVFRVAVCDNGPAGSGLDVFHVDVPSDGYDKTGAVAQGDIVKF